ncbi:MAG: NERD domain-containing protein [Bacillus sp. (in: firmicutes)]
MGQLLKLQDYVSRYEQDVYRYPTQYVRLKKQKWSNLHQLFVEGKLYELYVDEQEESWIPEKVTLFDKLKKVMRKKEEEETVQHEPQKQEELRFTFQVIPKTEEELKQAFLNQLFLFQMKWATSTIRERSFVDYSYYDDERLKFLLQRFPDTFLAMYQPVFQWKKAPVEAETIILTPTAAWCVSFLEEEEETVYVGNREKFWTMRHHKHGESKVLNPHIALQRTEWLMKQIFSLYDVELPIKKAIISRNGYIDSIGAFDLYILDKKTFPQWHQSMRNLSSPLKHQQLKAAEALLDYSQTTSTMRAEWREEAVSMNEE